MKAAPCASKRASASRRTCSRSPSHEAAADAEQALDANTETQTLENFLVGDSNRIAFGLARRLAMGAGVEANVVTIVGPHGVGKSHLLKGIEAALKAAKGEGSVLYMSSEDFTVAFVDGVKRKDTSDLRTLVRRAKVVLLDDFQFICSKPGTLVEFFSHLRAIVSHGGVVVLAADQTPALIDQLDERMRDEIHGGVIAQMELPERNLRREILRAKADAVSTAAAAIDADFSLTEEWIDLLADRLPASGRALCGAVRNVYCGTVLAGKPLDRAAVEKSIQLQMGGAPARAPKIDTIKDVTAKAYGVTKADLESACRKRQFAQPRQYAMYLSRQLTKCSYPQIGRMFGDRDHTTVLFAYRKISAMIAGNEGMAEELRQLEQRILADPRNSR
jgi:chromosomal replication initiator protein